MQLWRLYLCELYSFAIRKSVGTSRSHRCSRFPPYLPLARTRSSLCLPHCTFILFCASPNGSHSTWAPDPRASRRPHRMLIAWRCCRVLRAAMLSHAQYCAPPSPSPSPSSASTYVHNSCLLVFRSAHYFQHMCSTLCVAPYYCVSCSLHKSSSWGHRALRPPLSAAAPEKAGFATIVRHKCVQIPLQRSALPSVHSSYSVQRSLPLTELVLNALSHRRCISARWRNKMTFTCCRFAAGWNPVHVVSSTFYTQF